MQGDIVVSQATPRNMQLHTEGPTQLWCDNQGALELVKDPMLHARTKHTDVHHHVTRVRDAYKEVVFDFCPTTNMVADSLSRGPNQASTNPAEGWANARTRVWPEACAAKDALDRHRDEIIFHTCEISASFA
jgi:hypothetical protein